MKSSSSTELMLRGESELIPEQMQNNDWRKVVPGVQAPRLFVLVLGQGIHSDSAWKWYFRALEES